MSRVYFVDDLTPEQEANARKWIAALRSGDYQQGKHLLGMRKWYGKTNYCCLGVAACVIKDYQAKFKKGSLMVSTEHSVVATAGLPSPSIVGLCEATGGAMRGWAEPLADLNDERGAAFNQIADLLEADLAGELTEERYNAILGGNA